MIDDLEPVPPPYSPDDPLGGSTSVQQKLVDEIPASRINTGHGTFQFHDNAGGEVGALAGKLAARESIEHLVSQRQPMDGLARHTSLPSLQSGIKVLPDPQTVHCLGGEHIADIPTNRPVPSGLLSASLVTSLALQAVARRVQQRTDDISCAGRHHYPGCPSRRRRCLRKKLAPAPITDRAVEAENNGALDSKVPPPSPTSGRSTNHAGKNSDSVNLFTLSKSMADMDLTRQGKGSSITVSNHPDTRISSADGKATVATQPAFSNLPTLIFNKPERRALKSDLKALKHDIRAAARQVRSERGKEARSKGEICCRAMSFQEKKELRAWRRESLGEVRKVARSVRGWEKPCLREDIGTNRGGDVRVRQGS